MESQLRPLHPNMTNARRSSLKTNRVSPTSVRLPYVHRGFALLDCGLGILVGIIILSGWPADSVFILGVIVGIRLMIGGFLAIMIGAGIRNLKIDA
jgi:hypothetical protein